MKKQKGIVSFQTRSTIGFTGVSVLSAAMELTESVDAVSAVVEENTAATEQMAANSSELTQTIEPMTSVSTESSASVEEASAFTKEVSTQVEQVSASVAYFMETANALQQVVMRFRL